jgi:hypothetical protein
MIRNIIFIIFILFVSSNCFGQDSIASQPKGGPLPPAASSVQKIMNPSVKPLEIKGTVESVTIAEPARGIRPELSMLGADGKHYLFLVRSTTTIYSPDWKPCTLDKIVNGQNVRVQYITNKDGMLVALSIKPVM